MCIKTIQVPKVVFDTEKLKIGQKVKYLENWTRYDATIQNESHSVSGINEIDCIIRKVSENSLVLIESEECTDFFRNREIVYHNIYRIKPDDNYKIEICN